MPRLDDGATRLRSGKSVWEANRAQPRPPRPRNPVHLATEIVVIGAGLSGAFLAERLTRAGRRVVLVDRRAPATGSTSASTAMLLWELDAPMLELEDKLGFDAAARILNECRRAVLSIGDLVNALGIDCDFRPRPSLFLSGEALDARDLREEHQIRTRAGIAGAYLDCGQLAQIGFVGDAALLHGGAGEVDPVKLACGLIGIAVSRGAILLSPASASEYQEDSSGVTVMTSEGDMIRARTLVLANGYELPDFVPTPGHSLASSWAIATQARPGVVWPECALIWEAADPYLYMRSTTDGRIVAGGEDEAFDDPAKRDDLTADKVQAIVRGIQERCPALQDIDVEHCWAGVFGQTDDSLPMIGRVPGRQNSLAAFGYGGNGITFSAIAADMLEAELEGRANANADLYALDRDA